MAGPNYIKYEKQYSIGVNHECPTLEEIKKEYLKKVMDMPAILARNTINHLIEYDEQTLKVRWKEDLLSQLDTCVLIMIKGLLENKLELETKTY